MADSAKSSPKKKIDGKAYSKSSRCWPGYEPVPGKAEHEEGSCRKMPASRNAGVPVDRETARKKQLESEKKSKAKQSPKKAPK